MEIKERKILIANIPKDMHKQVKASSSFRGMNIRQWIELAIKMLLNHEKKGE